MTCQRGISAILASSFLGLSLAGCGQAPAPASAPAALSRTASVAQAAPALAAGFAATFAGDQAFRAEQIGPVVSVDGPEGIQLRYDFTRTPATGMVQVTTGDTVTEVPYKQGTQEWAWTVAKLAIRMTYGGVKAYYKYTRTHAGPDFNKEELVKAVVYGMLSQGVSALPGGFIWKRLLPIVWEWILKEPPIHRSSIKATYQRWARDLPRIQAILSEARTLESSAR